MVIWGVQDETFQKRYYFNNIYSQIFGEILGQMR